MKWNWQRDDWPCFKYDLKKLSIFEENLIHHSGILFGVYKHITTEEKENLQIKIISNEALKTSEIEGEYLNRESLQSSIRKNFGLQTDNRKIHPKEFGISHLYTELYKNYNKKLDHSTLYDWHNKLMCHRQDLEFIGSYRGGIDPMQIISGPIGNPKIHFEAPPSNILPNEMDNYIKWFNNNCKISRTPIQTIIHAGLSHLYFESIHPFEDGNGRIGRALSEKSLAIGLGQPTLISLSTIINKNKKAYYEALEKANKSNEVTEWLIYFSETILTALNYTQKIIEFIVEKNKLFNKLGNSINSRQRKLILRMFEEGHEGFAGGLSANNYISITKTTQPTATRDLSDLVNKGALYKTGERKSTRYYLNINL